MIRGIGSRSGRPPYVTGNHGKEGTDARGDRITHPAPARLWGVCVRGGRDGWDAVGVGPADGPGAVLRVWGVRDLGPGRPQLDGAAGAGSAVGAVGGAGGGGGWSRVGRRPRGSGAAA